MKALVRNKGETVTENDNIIGIDWDTGAPLTNEAWAGGTYALVNDYVLSEPVEGLEEPQPVQSTPVEEKPAEQDAVDLTETVTYGGKEYTLEELKKLIG